ncbi:hypothetical protein [Piscinibacter sp.]|jgi:hypothetical protein|uniref:hypothetical protein n=1 Tax=Piscinibacter sp. TaxID=1903157 RepID=UPI00355A6F06
MSTVSMSFGRPVRVTFPRLSVWFARTVGAVTSGLRRLDRSLLDRAAVEPSTPEEVLAWACRIENTDPGLASDLRAAALRAMDER